MWYVVKKTFLGAVSIGLMFGIFMAIGGMVWLTLNYAIVGWIVGITLFLCVSYMAGDAWDDTPSNSHQDDFGPW
jgi:hypothetical protein